MKKNLLLYIILIFLIVVNGFFLYKQFGTSEKRGPQRSNSANFISEQLQFDATQLEKFEELHGTHREKINTILRDIRASKDMLFDKASDKSVDSLEIEGLTTQIAKMEKAKGLETFRYFNAISRICNENQRERFRQIVKDGLRLQSPRNGNRPPGAPGRERRPPNPPRE